VRLIPQNSMFSNFCHVLKGAVKAPTALSGFSPYNRFTCSKAPRHSLQLWPNSPSQFSIKKTPR
ncbi:hypothetical protein, partial [Bacteroides acidifaciens]|uniref:hypothetical protein n=1 Tax=Bacteroides acidifaciens TaxID=85831 RepID=UPI0025582237